MMPIRPPVLREPPILLQILVLLLGGLIVAQLVTLLLTLVLPPAPPAQHSLAEIARALNGGGADGSARLVQATRAAPPEMTGPGWFTSDASRHALAQQLGTKDSDIRLAFYAPLPVEGITEPLPRERPAVASFFPLGLLLDQAGPPPGGFPGAGAPGGGFPGSGMPGNFPGGGFPRDGQAGRFPGDRRGPPGRGQSDGGRDGDRQDQRGAGGPPSPGDLDRQPNAVRLPEPIRREPMIAPLPTPIQSPIVVEPQRQPPPEPVAEPASDAQADPGPPPKAAPIAPRETPAAPVAATATPAVATTTRVAPQPSRSVPVSTALPIVPRAGLFGIAPAPFVEGDFVAALRLRDGRWSVVQPAPEAFPSAWQRRVILWFAIAFAIVAPLGWLFARRIVRPLARFTDAAEQLGRDPSAALVALEGPAEIGRAAHAFNVMQSRLRSFVDDRTAMVGAISHDLRTPLTRLRFRIEEVDDEDVRHGMTHEVEEMEAMITSVLAFIRDASTPGVRERLDLGLLVEDVAEDAKLIGGDVRVDHVTPALVEVDVLGMRRLLANLVENAVKYGRSARIRLRVEQDAAIAAIIDQGPGLPDSELERAFEPFYRSAEATASGKQGHGLGLAVCRSIARAHGGDVRLVRSQHGFAAELRLPLAYDARLAA